MNPFMNIALNMVQKNPKIAGNVMGKEFIDILKSGDEQRGIQMAENLCKSNNATKEDAIKQAMSYFGL